MDSHCRHLEFWTATFVLLFIAIVSLVTLQHYYPEGMDAITGRAATTVNITAQATDQFCNFTLVQGWNMASFYCLKDEPNVTAAMASVSGTYYAVFEYDPSDGNNAWKVYNPHLPSYVVMDLDRMDRRHGYWVFMNATDNYVFNGTLVKNVIPLVSGWNLVGYPSRNVTDTNETFNSIIGYYTKVYLYNTSTSSMQYYDPNNLSASTFDRTLPNLGYWVNATTAIDWSLP